MRLRTLVLLPALALALGLAANGFAQTDQGQNSDRPSHATQTQSRAMPMGMMGEDGHCGMMGGDMHEMMSMMRRMMTMMGGMMAANVEDRIASLKTDLEITDAQAPQWNRFADALRRTAKSMREAHREMMQAGAGATLPARLERQEKMLSAHLDSVRALKDALDPLYASFSDEQKKTADGMMIGPMGMM
jgi:hypothetical protein